MKIQISIGEDRDSIKIDAGSEEVTCSDVYCGIGIDTDMGRFGIAERDGAIEIIFNGQLIINSDEVRSAADGL